jgi:hypothetical protein
MPSNWNRRMQSVAALLLLMTVGAPRSWAWGHEGHRLTALVAEQYLTPETKAAVAELLAQAGAGGDRILGR